MRLELKYGQSKIESRIPDDYMVKKMDLDKVDNLDDVELIEGALDHADSSLVSMLGGGEKVALIISDYTRPTGTELYVPILISRLENAGIRTEDITIVIALGLHRPASEDEIIKLVTPEIADRIRVENHSAESHLADIGGTEFNATAASADLVICTGSVTFHPMAGFSGGYKSLLPGIASKKAIIDNHRLYFDGNSTHGNVGPGTVAGNPVLADIQDRSGRFKRLFCLNVVLGKNKKIDFASAGSVDHAWGECCRYLGKTNRYELDRNYPLVIASAGGYPADYSFYQCMKILNNSSRAAIPGGMIIIIAECSHGWEISSELFELFSLPLEEVAIRLKADFRMDALAIYMAMKVISEFDIHILTGLDDDEVKKSGMNKIASADDLNKLLQNRGENRDVIVMPSATQILPVITGIKQGGKS